MDDTETIENAHPVRREPLYMQLQRRLTEAIMRGDLKRGEQIPGEAEIAEMHEVSVGTARKALSHMVDVGFLERRPRHGTFVSARSPHHDLSFLYNYYRLHGPNDDLVTSVATVLSMSRRDATDEEFALFNLSKANPTITCVHRIRSVDGQPAMHERIYLPDSRFPDLPEKDELPNLMYAYFEQRYGLRITRSRESLRAEVANEEDHEHLGLTENDAVLVIEQTAIDMAHQPVEFRVCRATTNGFRYINEVR